MADFLVKTCRACNLEDGTTLMYSIESGELREAYEAVIGRLVRKQTTPVTDPQ